MTSGGEMTILKDTSNVLLAGTPAHRMLTELHLKKRTDVPVLRVDVTRWVSWSAR